MSFAAGASKSDQGAVMVRLPLSIGQRIDFLLLST